MTLSGSLHELPLLDVLQLLTVTGRSGVFRVASPTVSGELWLQRGDIVHAAAGDLVAEPAFLELASAQEGTFSFEHGSAGARTIDRPTSALLAEASRRLEAWQELRAHVPSPDCVPAIVTDREPTRDVVLTPALWHLVRNIDGQRTVAQIAGVTRTSLFDTCSGLEGLVRDGLVRLVEPCTDPGTTTRRSSDAAREPVLI